MITLAESTDLDFITLNIETANPDLASICQSIALRDEIGTSTGDCLLKMSIIILTSRS